MSKLRVIERNFTVEFLGYSKEGKTIYRVYVRPNHESKVITWLYERARGTLESALRLLGYKLEDINRKPKEKLSEDRRKKRNALFNIASKLFGKFFIIITTTQIKHLVPARASASRRASRK